MTIHMLTSVTKIIEYIYFSWTCETFANRKALYIYLKVEKKKKRVSDHIVVKHNFLKRGKKEKKQNEKLFMIWN